MVVDQARGSDPSQNQDIGLRTTVGLIGPRSGSVSVREVYLEVIAIGHTASTGDWDAGVR